MEGEERSKGAARSQETRVPSETAVSRNGAPGHEAVRRGTGIMPAVVLGIVLAAAIVVFVLQNQDRVSVEWLWLDFRIAPGALVLITAFLAVVADEVIGLVVRRHRRHRLDEREELERLHRRTDAEAV